MYVTYLIALNSVKGYYNLHVTCTGITVATGITLTATTVSYPYIVPFT